MVWRHTSSCIQVAHATTYHTICRIAGENIAHTPVPPLQIPTIKDDEDAIHRILMQIKTVL